MDDAVDVVVSGHTHSYLNTRVAGKLLVQSYSYGSAFDQVRMRIDRRSDEVVSSSADIPRTWHTGVVPDPAVADVVRRYGRRVKPLADRVVAVARRSFSRERSDLGRVVAAAQRAQAHAEIAFVNPGNMRDDLRSGPVTYANICAIEAYGHPVMRMKLRGRDIPALLEQQWQGGNMTLLFTSGLRYRHEGHRVTRVADERGRPLDPDRLYTVAANELIATGDRFSVLRDRAVRKRTVGVDSEALVSYLEHHPAVLR
jgi:5'-nucleotidase